MREEGVEIVFLKGCTFRWLYLRLPLVNFHDTCALVHLLVRSHLNWVPFACAYFLRGFFIQFFTQKAEVGVVNQFRAERVLLRVVEVN